MISKNLFFKLIKQDFKKRIWCPILLFIVFFLFLEIPMMMHMESIAKYPKSYSYGINIYIRDYFFGVEASVMAAAVCGAAFLCALSGYAYMHARTQVDAYHSLPVSRTQLFWSKYLSGILQFLFPFLIHVIICAGIAADKNAFSVETVPFMVSYIELELIIFVLAYSVSVIAAGLTGNIIISILGTGTLFCYSTILSAFKLEMSSRFLKTYVIYGNRIDVSIIDEKIWSFSPLSMIIKLFSYPGRASAEVAEELFKYDDSYVGVLIAAAIVYTLAAYIVYLKRPSEAGGKTIAFQSLEPVIKTLIVIPAAFFGGMFFGDTTVESDRWFLFGLIFSFVLLCILLEIIFRLDFRGILMHKRQFLFNAACVMLIYMIFRNDVLGYDTYVPADDQLQSCAVSIEQLMPLSRDIYLENKGRMYIGSDEYRMVNMEIQGNPSVMELARKAAKEKLSYRSFEYYEGIEKSDLYIETREREKTYRQVSFGYKLLNGEKVYRRYVIDIADADTLRLLADIFDDYDYKLGSTPMFNSGWNVTFEAVQCTGNFKSGLIELTPEIQSKIIEAYQSEYTKLTLDTVINTIPSGTIEFLKSSDEQDGYVVYKSYDIYTGKMYVYPQFTKTLALLKEYGFDMEGKLTAEDVESISVTKHYDESQYADSGYSAYSALGVWVDNSKTDAVEYTDKKQIQQILDSIICDAFSWSISYYTDFFDSQYTIEINAEDSKDAIPFFHRFVNGKKPDFIQ
ncbi:MAG: hypothetical protein K2N73_15500 [Lachnospiraceae bacterium]|nr:hypothetical protein [Lachnospiraceae bacterium]